MSFPMSSGAGGDHDDAHPHPHPRTPGSRSEVDLLASALHNALSGLSSHHTRAHPEHAHDGHAHPSKPQHHGPSLEILLANDLLTLRGVGVDVAPTLLSGHVVLNLTEATSIKALTLQFRGKARLPGPASESMSMSNSAMTYLICTHDWSFLEGEKKHSHTLKAGRHLFPFQLRIGGSLPSSVATNAFGGASVSYKLRATAVRPGLAHNIQTQTPVTIARAFTPEALEYQQTLEIENTWPEKLMYSIMIPHKAWAAGDTVTAVVKFSPIAKGARVASVSTSVNETVKLYAKTGWQETTKAIVSAKHEIIDGAAVCVDHQQARTPRHRPTHSGSHSIPSTPGGLRSGASTPGLAHPGTMDSYFGLASPPHSAGAPSGSYFQLAPHGHGSSSPEEISFPVAGPSDAPPQPQVPIDFEMSDIDVVTTLQVVLPHYATPTHGLEPIVVSHRIRWSILISNLDGHTSELRCSLPLHVLDNLLLDEAISATATTRRLLLGGPEVPAEQNEELELPSYSSHVRDRIANQYLPEQAVLRVTNPWVQQGVSPVQRDGSAPVSSVATPLLEAYPVIHHGAQQHGQGANLEYVNSELLLSLSSGAPPQLESNAAAHPSHSPHSPHSPAEGPTPPHSSRASRAASRVASRIGSRAGSRANSRAASPERLTAGSNSPAAASAPAPAPPAPDGSTFVHAHSNASRNLHGLFQNSMKPFTSLSPFRSHHHPHAPASAPGTPRGGPPGAPQVHLVRRQPNTSTDLLHRAFTEVPDYGVASRGFLGGITPLESYAGLPSYEQSEDRSSLAARSMSAPDLAAAFASARAPARAAVPQPPVASPPPAPAEA